ncbi:hypothetical protein K470DRAFT_260548 [Piedraia hortae CBS 480.64]|uniref:NTF2-like domain-containing protein n=1 Tax=Piedraia hortae CBS 480.64 TaxID=1314780 RepID=A0A6A7BR52_9PEZI|nr:hypothetical protein K470DRAFT_260548 [Piedraia hortae CBS 480.64]
MRFTLSFAACLALASALPEPMFRRFNFSASCMTNYDAQKVATNFKTLIDNYSDDLADAALTEGFSDYSDSVTTLIDSGCTGPQALGAATFDSRESFKAGQGAQPPIPFEQLNLWHNCDTVFLRWRSAQEPEPITGIIVLETQVDSSSGERLINTVYSEFNSGAWLVNLGVFKPSNCSSSLRMMRRA